MQLTLWHECTANFPEYQEKTPTKMQEKTVELGEQLHFKL
jgi:hypothetical protein